MKFTYHVSPNIRQPLSTQRIMLELTLGILVVLGYNVGYYYFNFGLDYALHGAAMIATAVVTSIVVEVAWALFYKKNPLAYLKTSFPWVTALLYVGMMGINKPLYVIFLGSLVAIVFGKLVFGGFGQNVFNPAGVGRAFSVLTFGGFITKSVSDVVTGATPNAVMEKLGWVITDPAAVSKYLTQFNGLSGLWTGNYVGALGETNTLLILAVGVYLMLRKIIDWRVVMAFLVSLFGFATVIMLAEGMDWWYPFFFLSTGGVMFGAIFMITDPVTTPTSIPGRIIFAIGVALLTTLIRVKGNLPEGMIRSILFMNMMTPLIDRIMDGWPLKSFRKHLVAISSVALVGLLGVALTTTAIAYIPPYVAPEEKPTLGDLIKFTEVTQAGQISIVSSTQDGDVLTVIVKSDGYAVLEDEHSEDPQPNEIEIKLNTATQTIVSVKFTDFNDSRIKKNFIDHPDFLGQFEGVSYVDPEASVDVSVGATYSTESVIRAVVAAIDAALAQ